MIHLKAKLGSSVQALHDLETLCFAQPWSQRSLQEHLENPARTTLVTTYGYVLGQLVLDEVELLRIGVPPALRRHGHGASLLASACQSWKQAGATNAFLEVSVNNPNAIALYLREGWIQTGRRSRYYADGADALCFGRSL